MKEQPGGKKLFMATSQSRDLESFSTELGELVPRSVACPVSMLHFGVDVIESKVKFHRHWQEQVRAALGSSSGGLAGEKGKVRKGHRREQGLESLCNQQMKYWRRNNGVSRISL